VPFQRDWTLDLGATAAPAWTLAHIQSEENQKAIANNALAAYAGGRGTDGEAGILDRIFQVIGETNRWCCEFGASDGVEECNTYDFVRERGWSAVYIEPDEHKFARLEEAYRERPGVHTFKRLVRFDPPDTIDAILAETPCPKALDLMVIDIDGCDYHIWQSIRDYRGRVVMIEFNSTIPPQVSYVQPRDMAVHHGSSLRALCELAAQQGYELVALTAWNAIFVQRELFARFGIANNHPTAIHRPTNMMHLFQLYDGTLVLGTWARLHWINGRLALEDIQVLPKHLRRFSRRLAGAQSILRPDGGVAARSPDRREVRLAAGNRFGASARDVTSQFGEDGIIEALLAPLQCGNRTFLDLACFGAKAGSRVWQLATTHGWTGHVVRVPSPAGAWECRDEFPAGGVSYIDLASIVFEGRLEFLRLIRRAMKGDIDFLSIGVDGADYQTWQSLQEFRPVLVAVGFNPTIPNDIYFVQAPRLDVNHGCSLYALVELARELGYQLAACSAATAFFVRRDYFHRLGLRNNDIESMHVPMSMHLFQLFDGTLRLAGLRRLLWHGLELAEDEIQILPRALRRWPTSVPPGPHADLYVDVN